MTVHSAGPRLRPSFARIADDHWALYLTEGVVLIVLGFLAVALAPFVSLVFTMLLGWIFVFSGIAGLMSTFWVRPSTGFWWSLLSGLLGLAAGLTLLIYPVSGTISLTIVLIAFFMVEGALTILFALDHRKAMSGHWGWILASGIVDLILAAIVLSGLPGSAVWLIGLLVGINMVFGGVAMIAMALHARAAAQHRTA